MASSTPSSGAPRVAVLTVSYGSERVLPAFLESVPTASAHELVTIVADNKPGAASHVEEITRASGAKYVALSANLGYGGALNAIASGLPEAIEWVLLTNPDVVLGPGAIDALVAVGDQDSAIGAVGPAILTSEGNVYPSGRAVPSLRTGVGHALLVNVWASNPWTRAYRNDTENSPVRRDVGWLSGACLLVRRSVFDEIGGFDDGYFMYFEDVDLGHRIGKAGHRNVYEPAAIVTHTGAHSTTEDSALMVQAHHDSARRFLNRKYSGPLLWPVRTVLTIGLRLRSWLVQRNLTH